MRALILAGGSGIDCLPLSSVVPKTLFHLHGKFILEYVINGLVDAGIKSLVIVKGYLGDMIDEVAERYRETGIHVDIVDQGPVEGIEKVIMACEDLFDLNEPFILAYGDILVPKEFYHHLLDTYYHSAVDAAIAVILWGHVEQFGVATINDFGRIEKITPFSEELDQPDYVHAGASILPGNFFELLDQEKTIDKTIMRLIKENRKISAAIWDRDWVDIGNPWDLLKANENLFSNLEYSRIHKTATISPTAHMSGLVIIEENVIIDHNAEIIGPCFIGKNTYIGTNTLIRGITSIERDCKIGFSVEIKNSVIQPETKIGRLSFIGDSIIGKNAMIGSGITTMNILKEIKIIKGIKYHKLGAIIGPNANLGANVVIKPETIIKENEIVPPSSVIK